MCIPMYPMCKCYKIAPKAFIYQKIKMHRYPRMTMNKKKRSLLHIEHDSLTHTHGIWKTWTYLGLAGVYIKLNITETRTKKNWENKSLTGYLYTEKNVSNKAHTWVPHWLSMGTQRHDMNLKKSDFSCLGSFFSGSYVLLSAINTNINYCVRTYIRAIK